MKKPASQSFENQELVDCHEKIKRVTVRENPTIHVEYSRLFDEMCQKYKSNNQERPVRDDFDDKCSSRTVPTTFRSRVPKKSCLKPVRSKSSDLCKAPKSFREKRKRMQSR